MMMIHFLIMIVVRLCSCVLVVVGHVVVRDVFVGLLVRGLFFFDIRVRRLGWVRFYGVLCEGLGLF